MINEPRLKAIFETSSTDVIVFQFRLNQWDKQAYSVISSFLHKI